MADLQEELQRFLTARFGVDVKDAFVSCIQKIHKENQNVAALEQPMKDATQQVLDIREEVVTASQNAVQTADDAKTIARAAESSASEALATAKNAKDESFNASGDAQLAMSAAQNMQQSFSNMELLLSGKVDGAFVENGYLYLTSNNEVVAGPLGPFSGTGGSGGSSGNNAVLAVSNTSGWLSKSIAYGKDCLIQITWSSLEDEMPTGNGVMKVTVNGIVKAMLDIPQGAVTADLGPYLSVGSNVVRIQVSDAYENSRTINFNINAIEASMSSTFDSGTAFDGIITFTYVPVGAISKTGHILLDGKECKNLNPRQSIKNNFALLTEERRATGIFGILDIRENSVISSLDRHKRAGFVLSDKSMKKDTQWSIDAMHTKTPTQETKIRSLSGGNQQKVIIGRWLLTEPDVLLLDEPTRGIDVGAKYEIYQLILDLACKGKTVLVVSSEMPELLGICDRILVMSGGRLAGEVDARTTTQEEIMTLAAKYV